jgi:Ca2+/Na+ antiporter
MWRVAIRAILAFGFSVFGRKVIALGGAIVLLFATALLVDLKMYVSAGLAGALAFAAVIAFFVQYRRQIVANRRRAQVQAEAAQRRAAAAEARSEKVDRAKAKVADTVKGMTAGAAGVAKTSYAGARDRVQGWRK